MEECNYCHKVFMTIEIQNHKQVCERKPKPRIQILDPQCRYCSLYVSQKSLVLHEQNCDKKNERQCEHCHMNFKGSIISHNRRCLQLQEFYQSMCKFCLNLADQDHENQCEVYKKLKDKQFNDKQQKICFNCKGAFKGALEIHMLECQDQMKEQKKEIQYEGQIMNQIIEQYKEYENKSYQQILFT